MLSEDVRAQVRERLASMEHPVKLVFFTRKTECDLCADTQELLEDLAGLSDRLTLEIHDFDSDVAAVGEYAITRVPCIAIVGDRDRGIRVSGIPAGYEFAALLEAILDSARRSSRLEPATIAALRTLGRPVQLDVYVTPT